MLSLTKDQRKECYEWLLVNYKTAKGGPYLCNAILTWMFGSNANSHLTVFHIRGIMELFPELNAQKPEDAEKDKPWWHSDPEGNLHRKIAILKALQLMIDAD